MHTVGALLRQWRQLRRLSQLDLAVAAEVSPRHVSLIETGKSNPSADMVLKLAAQLDVPLRDRNRLLLAAGFAPRYHERPLEGSAPSLVREAVERVLRAHEPYPALVLDRSWNLVLSNRALDAFLDGVAPELLKPPINIVRLALHPRGLASRFVNLTDVRAMLRMRLLRQLAARPDAALTRLYEECLSSGADGSPSPSPASEVLPMIFRVQAGREVQLFSTTTTFGAPLDVTLDELVIELYYPADDESARYFAGSGR